MAIDVDIDASKCLSDFQNHPRWDVSNPLLLLLPMLFENEGFLYSEKSASLANKVFHVCSSNAVLESRVWQSICSSFTALDLHLRVYS